MNTGVIARTRGPAAPLLDDLRRLSTTMAPQMSIVRAETLLQPEARSRRELRRAGGAAAIGGLLALLLSAVGLYSVVALAVGSRRREIGIRTALGAPRIAVVRMFFVRGVALSAVGLVLGLPLAVLAIRLVMGWLGWSVDVPPLLAAAVAAGVLGVAAVAAWIPARRPSAVDPVVTLGSE
jgi:predicted lysophospholipase L1 biosynthesis ABC-type transport system permease subunit